MGIIEPRGIFRRSWKSIMQLACDNVDEVLEIIRRDVLERNRTDDSTVDGKGSRAAGLW